MIQTARRNLSVYGAFLAMMPKAVHGISIVVLDRAGAERHQHGDPGLFLAGDL